MVRRLSLASLFILLASCPAAVPEAFFPIMAWNGPPNDLAALKEMRDCGLTVAGFVRPDGLDNCHAAGLKAIVSDPRVSEYDWHKVDPATSEPQPNQGRPFKSPEERRTAELRIRLTEAERELLDRICGRGASTWARDVILRAARAELRRGKAKK